MAQKQQIKIFLSSTFIDMQEERDYLIKKIFPAIKKECSFRGVDFVALDLRWGIDEQSARLGKVIEICMDEIVRSRPFFIGLLGGRYGWIPKDGDKAITQKLLLKYPWIRGSVEQGQSITEMEMQFGVLSNEERINAFFFQKEERSVPAKFKEKKGSEEEKKLAALKEKINVAARNGICSSSTYDTVKSLGKQVYDAVMARIEEIYPKIIQTRYQRFSMLQADYLQSRRDVYVRHSKIERKIKGNLIVTGSSGSGKSAFVANHAMDNLDGVLVYTVVNSDISSFEHCKRMMLNELLVYMPDLDRTLIDTPENHTLDLKQIFETNDFDKKVRWVIDGVDKFLNKNDQSCVWVKDLPSQISETIITTSEKSSIDASVKGRFKFIHINPLCRTEIMEIVKLFLKEYSKALSTEQMARISYCDFFYKPAVLKIFLRDLLQFGEYERLDEFIEYYLSSNSDSELILKFFKRLEDDFGKERMTRLFSCLYECIGGLPIEALIVELDATHIEWAAIHDVISPFVTERMGYMSIDDYNIREFVWNYYRNSIENLSFSQIKRLDAILKKEERQVIKSVKILTITDCLGYIFILVTRLYRYILLYLDASLDEYKFRWIQRSRMNLYIKSRKRIAYKGFDLISMIENGDLLKAAINQRRVFHISDIIRVTEAWLWKYMGLQSEYKQMVTVLLLILFEGQQKEFEKKRLLFKLKFLPAEVKELIQKDLSENRIVKNFSPSLLECLEKLDEDEEYLSDAFLCDISEKVMEVFTIVSDKEVEDILDRSLRLREKNLGGTSLLFSCIAAGASARLMNFEDAKQYAAEYLTVGHIFSNNIFLDNIELFKAVHCNDFDSLKKLEFKSNEIMRSAINIELCYEVKICQCLLLIEIQNENSQYYDRDIERFLELEMAANSRCMDLRILIDEYAQEVERLENNVVIILENTGFKLYNMRKYGGAYELFEAACKYVKPDEHVNRVCSLYYFMGQSAYHAKNYNNAYSSYEKLLKFKQKLVDKSAYCTFITIYDDLLDIAKEDKNILLFSDNLGKLKGELNEVVDRSDLCWWYNRLGVLVYGFVEHKFKESKDDKWWSEDTLRALLKEGECAFAKNSELLEYVTEDKRVIYLANRASFINMCSSACEYSISQAQMEDCCSKMVELLENNNNKDFLDCQSLFVKEFMKLLRTMGRWNQLSNIIEYHDDWGIRSEFWNDSFLLAYYSGKQRDEIIDDIVNMLVFIVNKAIFNQDKFFYPNYGIGGFCDGKNFLQREYNQIEELGIADEVLNRLKESVDEQSPFAYWFCIMKFGEYGNKEDIKEEGLDNLMSSPKIGYYYIVLSECIDLKEALLERGLLREEFERMFSCECDDGEVFGEHLESYLKFIEDQKEVISIMLEKDMTGTSRDYINNFLEIYLKHHNNFRDADRIYKIRKQLALSCDRECSDVKMLIRWMILKGDDESLEKACDIWNDNVESHNDIYVRVLYAEVLTMKGRILEAKKIFDDIFENYDKDKRIIDNDIIVPYISLCLNSGMYASAYEFLDSHKLDVDYSRIIMAYAGKLEEALLLYDNEETYINDEDNDEEQLRLRPIVVRDMNPHTVKSLLLIKCNLYEESQQELALSGNKTYNSTERWVCTLYDIEMARYYNRLGQRQKVINLVEKIKNSLNSGENIRNKGMCRYELSKLEAQLH